MPKNIMDRSERYLRARIAVVDFFTMLAKGAALAVFAVFAIAVLGIGFAIGLVYVLMMIGFVLGVLFLCFLGLVLLN